MAQHNTESARNQVRMEEHIHYSFVPNHRATMEALARAKFTNQEFRVIVALLNETNGRLAEEAEVTSTMWQALTLLSRQSIHTPLRRLVLLNVIGTTDGKYRVNHPNDWDSGVFQPQGVAARAIQLLASILHSEKEKANFRWLSRLRKSVANQRRSGRPETATTVANQRRSDAPDTVANQRRKRRQPATVPSSTSDGLGGTIGGAPSPAPHEKRRDITTPCKQGVAPRTQKKTPDPRVKELMEAMRAEFGFPEKTKIDPIPNYGKEGQAIKRMLTRGFTPMEILSVWRGKTSIRGEFVSMVYVNEDIGKQEGAGRPRGTSRNGSPPHRRTKHPPFRPRGEG